MTRCFEMMTWVALTLPLACGGSDEAEGEGSGANGSTSDSSGGGSESENEGDDEDDASSCEAPEALVVAEGDFRSLEVQGDAIYYISRQEDGPSSIVWHPTVDAPAQVLYPEGDAMSPVDLLVDGDTLYVLSSMDFEWALYRGPLAGGQLEPVGEPMESDILLQGLIGVQGDEILFEYESRVRAMSLTDGSVRTVTGSVDGSDSLQLSGGQLWLTTRAATRELVRYDVEEAEPMPTAIVEGGCRPTNLGHDYFVVAPDGVYCTNRGALERLALDGSTREELWPSTELGLGVVGLVDGDTVYFTRGTSVDLGAGVETRHSCNEALFDSILTTSTHVAWGTGTNLTANSSGFFQSTVRGIYAVPR